MLARGVDAVKITVKTDAGEMTVTGGEDFVVDWPDNAPEPGLAVLDKNERDNTAQQVAYFPPGHWVGVVKS